MAGIHSKAPDTWKHAQKGGARGQNLGHYYIFFLLWNHLYLNNSNYLGRHTLCDYMSWL